MKICSRCKSNRILGVSGKTSDCFSLTDYRTQRDMCGYVIANAGIGEGGDYIEFDYCIDCGQIQGSFPINEKAVTDFYNQYD